ncbi:spermatogenesis-associated protein 17 [Lobulomyces angularis]|nr:spermatogenesis-associated protein 17 [Lobulomyces angularis]
MSIAFVNVNRLNASDFISQFFEKSKNAEESRVIENESAKTMQKYWRGYVTRNWIFYLRKCVLKIQRVFRGYLGRKEYKAKVIEKNCNIRMNFYNSKAKLIQKHWRGFYSRKFIFNFFERKEKIKSIVEIGSATREKLIIYQENQKINELLQSEMLKKKKIEDLAGKNHHLIGTKAVPGVLNKNLILLNRKNIRNALKDYKNEMIELKEENLKNNAELKKFLNSNINKKGQVKKVEYQKPTEKVVQGPFLNKLELNVKKNKYYNKSLRIETDYYDTKNFLRETRTKEKALRINQSHLEITKYIKHETPDYFQKNIPYQKYGYGSIHFRETLRNTSSISLERFKNILPPISYTGE